LYYFKTKKDDDMTGLVALTADSFVRKEPSYKKKSKNTFAVGTTSRIFYMFPDSQLETDQWVAVITKNIDQIKNPKPAISNLPSNINSGGGGSNNNYSNNKPTLIDQTPIQQKPQEPLYIDEPEPGRFNEENSMVRLGTVVFIIHIIYI
jgi:hypothetical protein